MVDEKTNAAEVQPVETMSDAPAPEARQESAIVTRSRRRSRAERANALRTDLTRLFHGQDSSPYIFWCSGLRPLATRLTMIGHTASAPTLSRAMPLTGAWHVEGTDEGSESESDRINRYLRIGSRITTAFAQGVPVLSARVRGGDGPGSAVSGGSALPFVESLVRAWRATAENEKHIRIILLTDGSLDRSRTRTEEYFSRLSSELRMSIELVSLPKGYVLWRAAESELSRVGMTAGARSLTVALSQLQ